MKRFYTLILETSTKPTFSMAFCAVSRKLFDFRRLNLLVAFEIALSTTHPAHLGWFLCGVFFAEVGNPNMAIFTGKFNVIIQENLFIVFSFSRAAKKCNKNAHAIS